MSPIPTSNLVAGPTPMQEAGVTVHYSIPDGAGGRRRLAQAADKTLFAVTQEGPGWISLAFPENPGQMVPSEAIIYTPGQNPPVQVYNLGSKSVAGVAVSNAFPIDDIEVVDGGVIFSRAASATFDPAGSVNVLFARHDTTPGLAYH